MVTNPAQQSLLAVFPILFLVYINDLETFTEDSTASSFVDDTILTQQIEYTKDTESLQSDINQVIKWSSDNNMELHDKKFEYLSYRLPACIKLSDALPFLSSITSYKTPSDIEINGKSIVRDLGGRSPPLRSLYLGARKNKMVNSSRKMVSWILGVFRERSKAVMLQLYKSLIRSKLE